MQRQMKNLRRCREEFKRREEDEKMKQKADERKQRKKNATKIRKLTRKDKANAAELTRGRKAEELKNKNGGERSPLLSPLLRFECAYELHVLRGECIDLLLELNHATGRMDVEGAIFLARVVELTGQLRPQGFEIA